MRAIARHLTEHGIPTRTGQRRWERSVIWAILRNPAYLRRASSLLTKFRTERLGLLQSLAKTRVQ